MTKKVLVPVLLALISGWFVPSTDGISIYTLLLLRQQANARPQTTGNVRQRPQWGNWGQWSTCTSTVGMGVRARSRPCQGTSCERLPGDNYQLEQCNRKEGNSQNQNSEFLQKCNNDDNMRNTLSCRLYRENPSMAYDIFQSSGCLFTLADAQSQKSDDSQEETQNDLVFGRSPDTRAGEIGLAFQTQLDTAPLSSGRFSNEGITPRAPQSAASVVASALLTSQLCTSACEAVILQATGISRFGSNVPTTVSGILQLLSSNPIFRDNRGAISNEYSSCLSACGITGPTYGALRLNQLNNGQDRALQNPDLEVVLSNQGQGTGSQRKKRSIPSHIWDLIWRKNEKATRRGSSRTLNIPAGSLAERLLRQDIANANLSKEDDGGSEEEQAMLAMRFPNNTPQVNRQNYLVAKLEEPVYKKSLATKPPTLNMTNTGNNNDTVVPTNSTNGSNSSNQHLREKRQIRFPRPNRYRSPCFEREELSRSPRVLTLDDTESELFFYEGRQQQFLRRRCAGRSLFSNALYQAQEQVTQARTGQLAVCKQGYLRRYGLLIQQDPEGEFAFNDGERFSVKFRPFKLESHCSLSTLQ